MDEDTYLPDTKLETDTVLDAAPVDDGALAADAASDTGPTTPTARYLIFYHPQIAGSDKLASTIEAYLQKQAGVAVETRLMDTGQGDAELKADVLIALGGDGTMLRIGRMAAQHNCPVLGINLGRLGFLLEVQSDAWQTAIDHVLQGDYWQETRMMLQASHYRDDIFLGHYEALNDVVIARGHNVRPVRFEAYIDGGKLANYMADGLIIATPTGSTAYAFSVGGPILPPELQNMLLVPIAPHLSLDRTIVFSRGAEIDIIVHTEHDVIFSPDGQDHIEVLDGDRFHISASPHQVNFIRFQERAYFYQTLRDRMLIRGNPAASHHKKS